MVEESNLKYWRDAGHVARRTLEAMKDELQPGKTFHEIIEAAERFIHRHGGKPAFPGTIAVNDLAAHFTTNHQIEGVEGWDGDMVLEKGDCVKIDFGVHIKGHIGDNALTLEIGNSNEHTEQIKAAKEARDAAIEMLCQGRSIDYIRLHLLRPEGSTSRTTNAINARMNLLYAQGKINIARGDGNPREFNLEAEVQERVDKAVGDAIARLRRELARHTENREVEDSAEILREMVANFPTPIPFADEEE